MRECYDVLPYRYMNNWISELASALSTKIGVSHTLTIGIIALLAIWTLIWKGFALWYAARNHQKKWFILLLIVNTAGILEIIYLAGFRRDKQSGVTQSMFNNPLPEETDEEVASEAVA